jgi:AraC-like DNA-binding protein
MTGFGSKAFTDPDSYRALMDADIRLVVTGCVEFGARVSWVDMPCLSLFVIEETAPRVAFISLLASPLFVSFPLADSPSLVWNGRRLRRGDFVLHAPADRFHQYTTGATRWGLIAIAPKDLAHYGRTLLGAELSPDVTRLLRPSARSASDLLRLHAQAGRLARAKPDLLGRPEVARALELELVRALVTALGTAEQAGDSWRRRAGIMVRLEEALAAHDDARSLPVLCTEIGVPQRSLRICCGTFVGCSPIEYARLRRLNLVRSALLTSDRKVTSVARVARSHGFSQPGRFAAAYRALFGEAPLATLQRARP